MNKTFVQEIYEVSGFNEKRTEYIDVLSHAAYGKFIGIARERKIPFSYLHGVNMEQIVRQIYDSGR